MKTDKQLTVATLASLSGELLKAQIKLHLMRKESNEVLHYLNSLIADENVQTGIVGNIKNKIKWELRTNGKYLPQYRQPVGDDDEEDYDDGDDWKKGYKE